jgi:multisubunit Na+/H+ antiporter MnhE subunit
VTIWLLVNQRLRPRLDGGGFAVSIFVLVFVARVFQTSYLAAARWVLAVLLAAPSAGAEPVPPDR